MNINAQAGTVVALGSAQTLAWASSYYLPAVLAAPMARDLGVATPTVFAAFSASLLVSAALGPQAGQAIDRWGGRVVLIGTNLVFALGLLALGSARGPWGLFVAWAILGIGMGAGLYEAAFAALVRLYGTGSRNVITGITLIAGFASTVGWPLSALLESHVGWRGACFSWAALHLVLGIPLNAMLPRAAPLAPAPAASAPAPPATSQADRARRALLALAFAATWFISTAMAAHLPRLLQATGATLADCGRRRRARRAGAGRRSRARIRPAATHPSAVLGARGGVDASARRGRAGTRRRARGGGVRAAARRRQRHPDDRQGDRAAGALRSARLRPAPGLADGPGAHRPGAGAVAVRRLVSTAGAPAALWISASVGLVAFAALWRLRAPGR